MTQTTALHGGQGAEVTARNEVEAVQLDMTANDMSGYDSGARATCGAVGVAGGDDRDRCRGDRNFGACRGGRQGNVTGPAENLGRTTCSSPTPSKRRRPVPLIVLLHGSGRNGKTQTDRWEPLARKEGFIIAAPDALTPEAWRIPEDGPDFLYDLVELLTAQHEEIDRRRIYLFGHSAGAIHSLTMGLLESEYFAAVGVHAGALAPDLEQAMDGAARKIPMAIWVGTNDSFFPLAAVRATGDALNSRGFNTQLIEIRNHTHDYYSRAGEINKSVWEFLQKVRLEADPRYQRYADPPLTPAGCRRGGARLYFPHETCVSRHSSRLDPAGRPAGGPTTA